MAGVVELRTQTRYNPPLENRRGQTRLSGALILKNTKGGNGGDDRKYTQSHADATRADCSRSLARPLVALRTLGQDGSKAKPASALSAKQGRTVQICGGIAMMYFDTWFAASMNGTTNAMDLCLTRREIVIPTLPEDLSASILQLSDLHPPRSALNSLSKRPHWWPAGRI